MSSIKDKIQYRIELDSPLPGNMVCDAVIQVTAHETMDYRTLPRDTEPNQADAIAEAHLRDSAAEHIRKAIMGDIEDALNHAINEFQEWSDANYSLPCFHDRVQQKFIELIIPIKELMR